MHNINRRTVGVVLLLMAFVLVACGGDDNESDNTPPPPELSINEANNTDSAGLSNEPTDAIETRDYVLGSDDPSVIIIMYGDFQCTRCARYAQNLEILRTEFPEDLQIIWRHLPDTQSNNKSSLAFQAAEAAAAQGQFWDMHAMLYINQSLWEGLSVEAFRTQLSEYAQTIGLDVEQFNAALDDGRYAELVTEYQAQADDLEIVGVPTLLINGSPLNDRDDLFGLRGAIRLAQLNQSGYETAPEMRLQEGVDYIANIRTERGVIVVDLLENEAPIAVNNFIFLVNEGWYNDETFFLVIPDSYAQTGDPSETGRGNAGYFITPEHDNGLTFNEAGRVAMSHPTGELERNSSQFFITTSVLPNHETEWDGRYTIFGQVVEGLDVVRNLTPRNPGDPVNFPNPPDGDRIFSIEIEER